MSWTLEFLLSALEILLGSVILLIAIGVILLIIVAIVCTKKELTEKTNKIEKEGQNNAKDKNKP